MAHIGDIIEFLSEPEQGCTSLLSSDILHGTCELRAKYNESDQPTRIILTAGTSPENNASYKRFLGDSLKRRVFHLKEKRTAQGILS